MSCSSLRQQSTLKLLVSSIGSVAGIFSQQHGGIHPPRSTGLARYIKSIQYNSTSQHIDALAVDFKIVIAAAPA